MPAIVNTYRDQNKCLRSKLLDGVTANANGKWASVESIEKKSVHVVISGNATVNVCGSNEPAPDDDTNNGVVVPSGANITSSNIVEVKFPLRWIKANAVLSANAVVSAYLEGCP